MDKDNVTTYLENGRRKLDRESFDYIYYEEDSGDNKETIRYIQWSLMILDVMLFIALFAKIHSLELLTIRYQIAYMAIVVMFNVVMILSLKVKVLSYIMTFLSVASSIGCIIGLVSLFKIDIAIDKLTTDMSYETVKMAVVVPKKDSIKDIKGLSGYSIGYIEDDEHTGELITKINSDVESKVQYISCDNFILLAEGLLKGDSQAMLINTVYMDIINEIEGYTDFLEKIRVLYTLDVKVKSEHKNDKSDRYIEDDRFIVYLSGIDSYGDVNVKSRSDVNIIAAVNMAQGKIQLINTPRDYFVELPMRNGSMDKLTHTGIYGVDTSIKTLERLYNINIDYFFRINFSGFEKIIDELGGVNVYSRYAFSGSSGTYNKGINNLSGTEALDFSRERHVFLDGDIQRGNNQMEVIKGVVEKMTSTDFLKNYDNIMDEMSGCFQTDMSSRVIYSLVREQLDNNISWEIESFSVTGTGSNKKTFSMPTISSYVMIPNSIDIRRAKELIKDTLYD